MPQRFEPLITRGVYHIFNKTINSLSIFNQDENSLAFLDRIKYYRSTKSQISYSNLKDFENEIQKRILDEVQIKKYFKVTIFTYTLMPTHFHFLLRQDKENGIREFIANTLNSFTKYTNIRDEKLGPLFLPRFKSVKVTSDDLAKHISRYIHLNPYISGIVKNIEDLKYYKWSSFSEYINQVPNGLCDTKFIVDLFNKDRKRYENFIYDNADYQKSLESSKHLPR